MNRMVVIDDEYIVVEGIKAIIHRLNLDCEVVGSAENGIEGRKVIIETEPDLVFTDIRMPGLDGLSMIEEMKDKYPGMQFVIISGYTDFSYAKRAINLGVFDYLDKPVTMEKVQNVFSRIEEEKNKKRAEQTEMMGDEAVINAIIMSDSSEIMRCSEEYVHYLEHRCASFGELKEECYRFLCVVQEVQAGQQNHYDEEQIIPVNKVMGIETNEELMAFVKTSVSRIAKTVEAKTLGCGHTVIQQVLEYIGNHYQEDIGLTELAEQVDLNPAYLCILFKEEVGTSYVKYLTELRMKEAKKLLKKGKKVGEVSALVGYNNYRYFCDIFKKHAGVTPTEFRQGIEKS